jgi:hypothetical protein
MTNRPNRAALESTASMSELQSRLAVPIPKRLRTRPLDRRGYPVPWVVFIDGAGMPQFTINDIGKAHACRTKRLCGLCGNRMDKTMWFIGGKRCFTHEHGAFVDPPNHYECAEYALRVCPFLAAPSYARRIDFGKLTPASIGDRIALALHNDMPDDRPDCFGLGATRGWRFIDEASVYVVERWDYLEWWKAGVTCAVPEE